MSQPCPRDAVRKEREGRGKIGVKRGLGGGLANHDAVCTYCVCNYQADPDTQSVQCGTQYKMEGCLSDYKHERGRKSGAPLLTAHMQQLMCMRFGVQHLCTQQCNVILGAANQWRHLQLSWRSVGQRGQAGGGGTRQCLEGAMPHPIWGGRTNQVRHASHQTPIFGRSGTLAADHMALTRLLRAWRVDSFSPPTRDQREKGLAGG